MKKMTQLFALFAGNQTVQYLKNRYITEADGILPIAIVLAFVSTVTHRENYEGALGFLAAMLFMHGYYYGVIHPIDSSFKRVGSRSNKYGRLLLALGTIPVYMILAVGLPIGFLMQGLASPQNADKFINWAQWTFRFTI